MSQFLVGLGVGAGFVAVTASWQYALQEAEWPRSVAWWAVCALLLIAAGIWKVADVLQSHKSSVVR